MLFRSLLFLTCMLIQQSGAVSTCKKYLEYLPSSPDGVYTLRSSYPNERGEEYQTFCDMTTDGGGWTLVASIHENNLKGKCTVGDNWSSQQGNRYSVPAGDSNWINRKTFGSVCSSTEEDYKNPGYYDIDDSKSLAVWHVPNKTPMSKWRDDAILRYHTSCSSWENHGRNLFKLFETYPVRHGVGKCEIANPPASNNGPSIPITYDHGDNDKLKSYYPATATASFDGGYVTFRAFNTDRAVFALCSGAKPTGCNVEQFCIGGGGYVKVPEQCGDFSGFGDNTDADFKNAVTLIFYR